MSDNATVRVGWFAGAVNTGLHELHEKFHEFREGMNEEMGLGKLVAFGAIAEGIHSIMEEANELADLSERFGVLGSSIQRISNVAKQNGVNMEGVAGALNKLVINQHKVQEGDEEMAKALGDLHIATQEYINLSPEEAFYKIADAVKEGHDPMLTYAAVVTLLGKSAGALIPTLMRGSEEIKSIGNSAGVMSDEIVESMHKASMKMESAFHNIKVWGAEAFTWIARSAETTGAAIGFLINNIKNLPKIAFGGEDGGSLDIFKEQFQDIWHPKEEHEKHEHPEREMEEGKEKAKELEEAQKIYEKIAENERERIREAMQGEARLNDLIAERNDLYAKAAQLGDKPKEQAEAWLKASEIEKKIVQERDKQDKEFEEKQKRIMSKRESFEKKALEYDLAGMDREHQMAALLERRDELTKKIGEEKDLEKAYDLLSEREDIMGKLRKAEEKDDERKLVTSSLGRLSGGGAYLARNDPMEKQVEAVKEGNKLLQKVHTVLESIKEKTGKAYWQP